MVAHPSKLPRVLKHLTEGHVTNNFGYRPLIPRQVNLCRVEPSYTLSTKVEAPIHRCRFVPRGHKAPPWAPSPVLRLMSFHPVAKRCQLWIAKENPCSRAVQAQLCQCRHLTFFYFCSCLLIQLKQQWPWWHRLPASAGTQVMIAQHGSTSLSNNDLWKHESSQSLVHKPFDHLKAKSKAQALSAER